DANGCTYVLPLVVVDMTNNLTLTPAVDPDPICEGGSVALSLNTNATQFTWTGGNPGLSAYNIAAPVANPSVTTLYTVTVTLGECSTTDDVLVQVIPAPIPDAGERSEERRVGKECRTRRER